jgi:hypothetical protein
VSRKTNIKIYTGGPTIFLAGLMMGTFINGNKIQSTATIDNLFSLQNVGIAAVTPAYKLYEILFSKEIIKSR